MTGKSKPSAIAGIYDHAGWAIVVCVAGRKLLDKRRIELIDPGPSARDGGGDRGG